MPTGHTHRVIEGEITTAREFALECARSFRHDINGDGKLRYPQIRDYQYIIDNISEDLNKLTIWDKSSEEEKYALWSEYVNKLEASREENREQAELSTQRLNKVLVEVESIDVPESHANFKRFLVGQLTDTLRFDGTFDEEYYRVTPYEEWVDSHRSDIVSWLNIHLDALEREIKNTQKTMEWVSTLARLFDLEIEE